MHWTPQISGNKVRHQIQEDRQKAFHVAGPTTDKSITKGSQTERIAAPHLTLGRNHVAVTGQHETGRSAGPMVARMFHRPSGWAPDGA